MKKLTQKEGEDWLEMCARGKGIDRLSPYVSKRKNVLWRCRECGREWEAEGRSVLAYKKGCPRCALPLRRKPNKILLNEGGVLTVDVSASSQPDAKMLIDEVWWDHIKAKTDSRVSASGKKGYAHVKFKGKREYVHRIVAGFPKETDHINGIKLDNRSCNLRVVTSVQNQMNRGFRKTNTSGHIGVSPRVDGWEAKLCIARQVVHRSRHKHLKDAVEARRHAVERYCGEFAPKDEITVK